MNRLLPLFAFLALSFFWPRAPIEEGPPLAPDRPLASLLPASCLVYLEGCGLQPLLELGLGHPFVQALGRTALGADLVARLPHSPEESLHQAEEWLGRPPLPLLASLARHGAAFGFDPESRKTVLVLRGAGEAEVARQLTCVFDAIERQIGVPGAFDRPQRRKEGADIWSLGEACIARRGDLLVLGNGTRLMEDVLQLAADPSGRGLLERLGFEEQRAATRSDTTVWAWIDMAGLEPFADPGFRGLREASRNPAAQGLLGAEIAAALSARTLSAGLSLEHPGALHVEFRAFEAPTATDLAPSARAGVAPVEIHGPNLASALLYRDYSRFFTRRQELFPPAALPSFAEALTNAALFFEGRDLGEEVLTELSPWIRIVVRRPHYGEGRAPAIPLPALAVLACLEHEQDGEQWIAAFQTIISVLNVDQAQKGKRSLRLVLEREGEISLSVARFATPEAGDGVDLRYNLEPALAVVGRHLVVGTHVSLVREIVRSLGDGSPAAHHSGPETLEIDGSGWRAILEANLEFLVARKILEDGLEPGAARSEIEGLRRVLDSIESVRAEVSGTTPTAPELHLELRFAPGSPR